jgi:hypothetical protein
MLGSPGDGSLTGPPATWPAAWVSAGGKPGCHSATHSRCSLQLAAQKGPTGLPTRCWLGPLSGSAMCGPERMGRCPIPWAGGISCTTLHRTIIAAHRAVHVVQCSAQGTKEVRGRSGRPSIRSRAATAAILDSGASTLHDCPTEESQVRLQCWALAVISLDF